MAKNEVISFLIFLIQGIAQNYALNSSISAPEVKPSLSTLKDSVCNGDLCNFPKPNEFRFCNCGKGCFETGDCCLGVYSPEEETEIRQNDRYVLYQHQDIQDGSVMKVIGKCPRNSTNVTEIQQCHNSVFNTSEQTMMFPMTSTLTNITYKNLACARCNEGTNTQFQLQFNCLEENKLPESIEEALDLYLSNRTCLPIIPSNAVFLNYLFFGTNDTIVSCSSTLSNNDVNKWRCASYFAPFTYNGRRFKNIFCAECNGIHAKQEDVVCRKHIYPSSDTYTFQVNANYSIGGETPLSENQTRCPPESVFDPYQQQCRSLFSTNSPAKETTVDATDQSETSFNVSSRITIPKCILQTYNKSEYEERNSSSNEQVKEVVIKASNETYQYGEYNILMKDNRLEVCEKQNNSSLPLCLSHYCPSQSSDSFRDCSCSSDCFKKGDCCLNALTKEEVSSARENDYLDCIRISSYVTILTVNRCPKNYENNEVRYNCESLNPNDPFLQIPVYSSVTNATYKNIYCGICHEEKDLLFLPFEITCDDVWNSRTVMTALRWTKGINAICKLSYRTYSLPVSYCSLETGDTCPKDWKLSKDPLKTEVDWMCQRIKALIRINKENSVFVYRNVYCAQCNGINLNSSDVVVECEALNSLSELAKFGGSRPAPSASSLTILFKIGK